MWSSAVEQPRITDGDFYDLYFEYVKESEAPVLFHRWAITTAVSAWLGRSIWFPFGSGRLFPTMYTMFVGNPGTRKSTAIRTAAKLIGKAGYDSFGPQRTSKEKFLVDLAANSWDEEEEDGKTGSGIDILKSLHIGASKDGVEQPHEVFVAADEFNNFIGAGNIDFQSLLGELWDWDEPDRRYTQRLKNSKSIAIYQPTVTILGGTTPTQFAECFPLASIGQGFMSRLLLIYAEETGKKITFPPTPSEELTKRLVEFLVYIRSTANGAVRISDEARIALDTIYRGWPELDDTRFKHYSTRRFTHLIKLCMVVAAMRLSMEIGIKDVIHANTLLAFAESTMPKAIGELGKSKNSEATNKIMQVLYDAREPKTLKDLWKVVQNDLDNPGELAKLLINLSQADKVQTLPTKGGDHGYLPRQKAMSRNTPYVNFDYLKGRELK